MCNGITITIFLQCPVRVVAGFLSHPSLGVNLTLQLSITGSGRSNKITLFIIIGTQSQISGSIIFDFVGSIALGYDDRFSLSVQIFHLRGQASFRIIGQFPGSKTVALQNRTPIGTKIQFIGHMVGIIIFTFYLRSATDQGGHVLCIIIGNGSDIAFSVIIINGAGITVAVGDRSTILIEELFTGVMSGIIIAVNLGSIGAIHGQRLIILPKGHFPQKASLAVILPQHGSFPIPGSEKCSVFIVIMD